MFGLMYKWLKKTPFGGALFLTYVRTRDRYDLPRQARDKHASEKAEETRRFFLLLQAWDSETNPWGQVGYNYAAGKVNKAGGYAGLGTHGSLSPYDMRATMAAVGPAFRERISISFFQHFVASCENRQIYQDRLGTNASKTHARAVSSIGEDIDVTHATAHPDVAPTVLAALGLPIPSSVEGRPIIAALRPEVAAAAVKLLAAEVTQQEAAAAAVVGGLR